ncbi:LysR family transcriptional regulator [Breoghania sp.]
MNPGDIWVRRVAKKLIRLNYSCDRYYQRSSSAELMPHVREDALRFKRLDLNLLVALDQLLTLRSTTLAGQRMNLTQSAMSSALRRMRDYFEDPLLIQVGRQMQLTPRAEALRRPIRDILVQIDSVIAQSVEFDAAASDREFRIILSDYALNVLAPHVLALAQEEGASVKFRFLPQVTEPSSVIEKGDADLVIAPSLLLTDNHPSEPLYRDVFVAITWAGAQMYNEPLTLERYLAANHIVMTPLENMKSVQDSFMAQNGMERNIGATCFSFAALGPLVVGTDFIATVHGQLAALLVKGGEIKVHSLPFESPSIVENLQWQAHMTNDPGILWLRDLLRRAACRLMNGDPDIDEIDALDENK